jgi:spore maturation protein CgeB
VAPPLNDEDYVYALKAAKIGLCVFSQYNHNQTAGRSFEIPACGTFLLALRSPQHTECYVEGVEAEFFDSHDELVRKARFYLANDRAREVIAARGHQRCMASGYSWAAIMKRDWKRVSQVCGLQIADH